MGYMVDLDEYSDQKIIEEYNRRLACAEAKVCPYCFNCDKYSVVDGKRIPNKSNVCRMTTMHDQYNKGHGMSSHD